MNVDFEAFTELDKGKLYKRFGLEQNGRLQKVLDTDFISHMCKLMPYDEGIMSANTIEVQPGLIQVQTPYAHYMNEGIKYVDPKYHVGAFFSPNYGYWSRPGIKKVSSGEPLNYNGGADRGAHYVERTITNYKEEIIEDLQKEVDNS